MPFREIYPWLARALSPGCYLHVLEPCNVSFWEKRKKKGGFSRLVDWYESEGRRRKKTNAHMDLSDRLLLALSIHGLQSNLKVRCSN